MTAEDRIIILGDINYRIGRLDTFVQFHIARRLAPLLANLGQALKEAAPFLNKEKPKPEEEPAAEEIDYDALGVAIGPIAQTLAKMSDEDVNYILHNCLAVCQREIAPNRYAPIQVRGGTRLMFEDIDMPTMIGLAINTIQDSLASFFPTGPQTSAAKK